VQYIIQTTKQCHAIYLDRLLNNSQHRRSEHVDMFNGLPFACDVPTIRRQCNNVRARTRMSGITYVGRACPASCTAPYLYISSTWPLVDKVRKPTHCIYQASSYLSKNDSSSPQEDSRVRCNRCHRQIHPPGDCKRPVIVRQDRAFYVAVYGREQVTGNSEMERRGG
jgi:hypothetical protein